MTEAPIITPTDGSSTISAVLSTASVEVLKEEEAYSFLSLVSDCGGVLGLFIGFNFLMVVDAIFIFSVNLLKSQ